MRTSCRRGILASHNKDSETYLTDFLHCSLEPIAPTEHGFLPPVTRHQAVQQPGIGCCATNSEEHHCPPVRSGHHREGRARKCPEKGAHRTHAWVARRALSKMSRRDGEPGLFRRSQTKSTWECAHLRTERRGGGGRKRHVRVHTFEERHIRRESIVPPKFPKETKRQTTGTTLANRKVENRQRE